MKLTVESLARICHQANKAYCEAIGDNSQPDWEQAPAWQRDSARLGVRLHLDNPDAGPQASHESWMEQKVMDGWVWGPVKDPDTKKHPCIVPFSELPEWQQAKDKLFCGTVASLRHLVSE